MSVREGDVLWIKNDAEGSVKVKGFGISHKALYSQQSSLNTSTCICLARCGVYTKICSFV